MPQIRVKMEGVLIKVEMARKDDRIYLAPLGEWYEDLLTIDSWIVGRTKPQQGNSLLCAKLQERESKIRERVKYLAEKRGKSEKEMWTLILTGKAEKISPDELEAFLSEDNEENSQ